jgi:hypothetical protein
MVLTASEGSNAWTVSIEPLSVAVAPSTGTGLVAMTPANCVRNRRTSLPSIGAGASAGIPRTRERVATAANADLRNGCLLIYPYYFAKCQFMCGSAPIQFRFIRTIVCEKCI